MKTTGFIVPGDVAFHANSEWAVNPLPVEEPVKSRGLQKGRKRGVAIREVTDHQGGCCPPQPPHVSGIQRKIAAVTVRESERETEFCKQSNKKPVRSLVSEAQQLEVKLGG